MRARSRLRAGGSGQGAVGASGRCASLPAAASASPARALARAHDSASRLGPGGGDAAPRRTRRWQGRAPRLRPPSGHCRCQRGPAATASTITHSGPLLVAREYRTHGRRHGSCTSQARRGVFALVRLGLTRRPNNHLPASAALLRLSPRARAATPGPAFHCTEVPCHGRIRLKPLCPLTQPHSDTWPKAFSWLMLFLPPRHTKHSRRSALGTQICQVLSSPTDH